MKASREHIDPGNETGFLTRKIAQPRFDSVYHFHPEYEITLIQSSQGQLLSGDYLGKYYPGHLVLYGPNLPHWYFNEEKDNSSTTLSEGILIQFQRQCLGEALLRQPEMRSIDLLLKSSGRGVLFTKPVAVLEQLMESLLLACGVDRILLLIELLKALATQDKRQLMASPSFEVTAMPVGSRRLERVLEHIQQNFDQPLKLENLAGLANMSESAFSRFFHQHMGLPVSKYILLSRLTESARLLVDTRQSISEIAFSAGFNNLTHFNRQFKKWKNQTPSEFRNLLHGSQA